MCGGGYFGDFAQHADVLCGTTESKVRDHRRDRLTAWGVVFLDVDVLEQAGLGGVGGFIKVVHEFLFGDVEQFDLGVGLEVGAVNQELEAAPGGFHGLEVVVVWQLKLRCLAQLFTNCLADNGFQTSSLHCLFERLID